MRSRSPAPGSVLLVALVVAMLATACGNDSTDAAAERQAPEATDTDSSITDAPATGAEADADEPTESSEPVRGGELTLLVEGETVTWDLPNAECATSCVNVLRLVGDPLFVENADGDPTPFLLEDASVDSSLRIWTLTLRDGITFQNGEPLDADSLAADLDQKSAGAMTGALLADVDTIESDGELTVTVTFGAPHASFAAELTSVPGFPMAPAYYADGHDRGVDGPIGTGPFTFEDWMPGDHVRLERSDTYWRQDAEGRTLPFVDSVIVRPVPTKTDREAIVEAGDADVAHVDDVENPARWLEDWDGGLLTGDIGMQTSYGMFNADVEPFSNRDARLAVAQCTDRDGFNELINPASTTASGPFAPGSVGHLDDAGFPAFDPDAGSALVEALGGLAFEYLTTDDASEGLAADLLSQMWADCGMDVAVTQESQGAVISRAILGDYDLVSWRLHGSTDPAAEYLWWHSDNAEGLALNAGRIRDDEIDAGLEILRSTLDPAEREEAAERINRAFGEGVYNLWYAWSEWWVPHGSDVHGVGVMDLPDGGVARPKTHGDIWLQQAWVEPG